MPRSASRVLAFGPMEAWSALASYAFAALGIPHPNASLEITLATR